MREIIRLLAESGNRIEALQRQEKDPLVIMALELTLQDLIQIAERILKREEIQRVNRQPVNP